MKCPVCSTFTKTILVCHDCWLKVPQKDQSEFRRQYQGAKGNPKAWSTKAEKIIRELNAKRGDQPASDL